MKFLSSVLAISGLALFGCDTLARANDRAPAPVEKQDGQVTEAYRGLPPYPSAPADPWAAVVDGQPRRFSEAAAQAWTVRDNDFACTAVHDHCLAPDLWLIENDDSAARSKYRTAAAYGFGPNGPMLPLNAKNAALPVEPYTAYRTVPATKKNLKPGALVMALTFPRTQLTRGSDVFSATWNTGVVDRVDWDLGFVFLVGQDRNYWITATRTVVLAWKPGAKVEIVGGGARDSLAVRADEVIAPQP